MPESQPDLARLRIDRSSENRHRGGGRWVAALLVPAFGFRAWFARPRFGPGGRAAEVELSRVQRVGGAQAQTGTSANGYVVARRQAALSTDVQGRLVELRVQEGDRVRSGDILARLDTAQLEASLERARGEIAQARALAEWYQVDYDRLATLLQSGTTRRSDYDLAKARLREAQARVDTLQAAARELEVIIEKSSIRAPFDGIVTRKNAEVGEVVSAVGGAGADARAAIVTLVDSTTLEVQVELAQMEYLLPRLARMWTHLSRIRGGIGLRGPGETQLETDRRLIRKKIQALKAKLVEWERHREVLRAGRTPMLSVALVGYTNAGKSSLLRMLSAEHDIFVEDRLFATLDTLTREVVLGEGCHARVSDTVGFIRKLPHHLVASFRATLEEVREADVLLHVVDASHPGWEAQMEVVDQVLADIGIGSRPVVPVFNKMDAVRDPGSFAARVHELDPTAILTSTLRLDGLAGLKTALRERERALRPPVQVLVPLGDGARLASLYRIGEVTGQTVVGDTHVVEVRMAPWQVEVLRREGVEVRVGNGGALRAG